MQVSNKMSTKAFNNKSKAVELGDENQKQFSDKDVNTTNVNEISFYFNVNWN